MKTTDKPKSIKKVTKPVNKPVEKPNAKLAPKIVAKPVEKQSGVIKPEVVKQKPQTPVECVIDKYRTHGWIVMFVNGSGINDIIAQKTTDQKTKLHFIQVVTDEDAAKHNGNAKNDFIQNAFSNQAVPVYAYIDYPSKDKSNPVITFEDVNIGARVIIGHNVKKPDVGSKPAMK